MAKKRDEYGFDGVFMSDDDLDLLDRYKEQYRAASDAGDQNTMRASHDAAEALRAKYNYTGGSSGNEYRQISSVPQFSYDGASDYVNRYQDQIDQLTDALMNRPEFSYDYETDPRWQAYKKQYTREGRRSSEDVLGQYAAMTGGMPSTAAMTAAQQAGNYYNAQMTDKIPELYNLAYNMYLGDLDQKRSDLSTLRALEGDDYNRYNADRSFQFSVFGDQQERQRQAQEDARNRIDVFIAAGWNLEDIPQELVSAAGYTSSDLLALQSYAQQQAAAARRGGGGGSRSGAAEESAAAKAVQSAENIVSNTAGAFGDSLREAAAEVARNRGAEDKQTYNTVSSAEQLGGAAMNLYQSISRIRDAASLDKFLARIDAALASGQITAAEADFLYGIAPQF